MKQATPPPDTRLVLDAAEVLRVREIDLFRLAWHRWHGRSSEDAVIERAFAAYMFGQRVPGWVRHYARDVLAKAERGRLQPLPHGVVRRRPEPPVTWPGGAYVAITMAIAIAFVFLLAATPYEAATNAPLACETGPGMRLLARMAYAFSADTPPDCAVE